MLRLRLPDSPPVGGFTINSPLAVLSNIKSGFANANASNCSPVTTRAIELGNSIDIVAVTVNVCTIAIIIYMRSLRQVARQLKQDTYAVYLASIDRQVPWYARMLAGVTVAYAFSPIDLIPDFIPILGYLDDFYCQEPIAIDLAFDRQ